MVARLLLGVSLVAGIGCQAQPGVVAGANGIAPGAGEGSGGSGLPGVSGGPQGYDTDGYVGSGGDGSGELAEPDAPPSGDQAAIDAFIASLGTPATPSETSAPTTYEEQRNDRYICKTYPSALESKNYTEIAALPVNAAVMFPGAIVNGNTFDDGILDPVSLPLGAVKVSASLEDAVTADVAFTLQAPSLSAFREQMGTILTSAQLADPGGRQSTNIIKAESEDQVALALGLHVNKTFGRNPLGAKKEGKESADNSIGVRINAALDWSNTTIKSRYVARFTQEYYTVDVDVQDQSKLVPSDFFHPSVTLEQVQTALGNDPPAFISSITYGREVYFTFVSTAHSEKLEASIEAAINHRLVGAAFQSEKSVAKTLSETEIKTFLVGGNPDAAMQAVNGIVGVQDFIKSGAYSADSRGVPIAYKLRYLDPSRTLATMARTAEYQKTECRLGSQVLQVKLRKIELIDGIDSDDVELMGEIWVQITPGERMYFFRRMSNQRVVLDKSDSSNIYPPNPNVLAFPVVQVDVEMEPRGACIELAANLFDYDGSTNRQRPLGFGDNTGGSLESRRLCNTVDPVNNGWLFPPENPFVMDLQRDGSHVRLEFTVMPFY